MNTVSDTALPDTALPDTASPDSIPPGTALPQVALALSQPASLQKLLELGPVPGLAACLQRLGCPMDSLDHRAGGWRLARIHFGNEFCERLLPMPRELQQVIAQAKQLGVDLALVTPMLTESGIGRLKRLLPLLEDDSEVVINDWGTLQLVRTEYPALVPVLGRMLNKMIKDPRLPSEQWTRLHPHNSRSQHFHALLGRFGLGRLEMDVPPFARVDHFDTAPIGLSVHLPYGYTVRGRMCRIGSVGLEDGDKFVAAHGCQKECLDYWTLTERGGAGQGNENDSELYSFQRGNSWFYRHSTAMAAALWEAVQKRRIERLVFAGDWHENHRAT